MYCNNIVHYPYNDASKNKLDSLDGSDVASFQSKPALEHKM